MQIIHVKMYKCAKYAENNITVKYCNENSVDTKQNKS